MIDITAPLGPDTAPFPGDTPFVRVVLSALLISVVGLVFVTYTGHLGGTLVYNHGLGVTVPGLGQRHF